MYNQPPKILVFTLYIFLCMILLSSCFPKEPAELIPITSLESGDEKVYLPTILNGTGTPAPTGVPLIHVPYKDVNDFADDAIIDMAVFWLGEVRVRENYTDVRIGYTNDSLYVHLTIFDRLLWYDPSPSPSDFVDWDTASLFLIPDDQSQLVTNQAYRFLAQLAPYEANRNLYQAAFKWTGSSWLEDSNTIFSTDSDWRGEGLNTPDDDRGYHLKFVIPFTSLGLSGKPANNTIWRMGLIVHDRDYFSGTIVSPQNWPKAFSETNPQKWGQLSFGALPSMNTSDIVPDSSVSIRQGLNGFIVPDASIGGYTTCGEGLNFWTEWGDKTYANPPESMTFVVQNQRDVADFPCFSKYFVQFPLDSIPANAEISSAAVTLHQYGNSGTWGDPVFQPYRSIIQALVTDINWDAATITWNNAPEVLENVASEQVEPLPSFPNWPGIPYHWDLTYAVQKAIDNGQDSISLAFYSADGAYHSGKYFSTSDVEEWNQEARPTLNINYISP